MWKHCVITGLLFAVAALGQTVAKPPLVFEVASIKPAGALDPGKMMNGQMRLGMTVDQARVDISSMTLADLICLAFKIKPYQIVGPGWLSNGNPMSTERFSIQAKMPEGATKDDVPEMMQALLKERFAMAFHRDEKEQAIYALVVGKNGPKLKESLPDEPAAAAVPEPPPGGGPPVPPPPPPAGGAPVQMRMQGNPAEGGTMTMRGGPAGGTVKVTAANGVVHMEQAKMTTAALADLATRFLDRPVVDMTELKGNYQMVIDLSIDDMRTMAGRMGMNPGGGPGGPGGDAGKPAEAASDPTGGTIFQSVAQMGLKLEPRKVQGQRLIIDHVEKTPTEN